ncbi:hypothetical protein Lpla01_02530 [Lactiplantibacillus plajomi]
MSEQRSDKFAIYHFTFFYSKMFIAHTGYLELFDLVVKHILPGMGLFFYFVLHFNCKFAN